MKTTIEIPDATLRRAKVSAAQKGIPLRQFVREAVEAKLRAEAIDPKPWAKYAGQLRHLRKETARISAIIEKEFGVIEPEDRL